MTPTRILSLFLCFCLILEQGLFAQTVDLSHYFARNSASAIPQSDKFRPLHLRYISYDNQANDFKILLDKGDFFNQQTPKLLNSSIPKLEDATRELMKYFFIGLSLPNEKFWVNLRPDSPDNILDPELENTDIGRIFLEADLQLKKDTSGMTSPQTKEGREYWDKLYKKAGELFGSENITIPTITRPWIVPKEIIIREAPDNAYIYKATLKVMLEEDYLIGRGGSRTAPAYQQSAFSDPRLKELNEYSTQLIREAIIPKLTYAVNTAKRYAPLRQVYYSLILAQWFKQKYGSVRSTSAPVNSYIDLIDSGNLANLASKEPYDKQAYFQQYQKSFKDGEYNLQEPVYTPMGQSIRRYVSGGVGPFNIQPEIIAGSSPINNLRERDYLEAVSLDIANKQTDKGFFSASPINEKSRAPLSPREVEKLNRERVGKLKYGILKWHMPRELRDILIYGYIANANVGTDADILNVYIGLLNEKEREEFFRNSDDIREVFEKSAISGSPKIENLIQEAKKKWESYEYSPEPGRSGSLFKSKALQDSRNEEYYRQNWSRQGRLSFTLYQPKAKEFFDRMMYYLSEGVLKDIPVQFKMGEVYLGNQGIGENAHLYFLHVDEEKVYEALTRIIYPELRDKKLLAIGGRVLMLPVYDEFGNVLKGVEFGQGLFQRDEIASPGRKKLLSRHGGPQENQLATSNVIREVWSIVYGRLDNNTKKRLFEVFKKGGESAVVNDKDFQRIYDNIISDLKEIGRDGDYPILDIDGRELFPNFTRLIDYTFEEIILKSNGGQQHKIIDYSRSGPIHMILKFGSGDNDERRFGIYQYKDLPKGYKDGYFKNLLMEGRYYIVKEVENGKNLRFMGDNELVALGRQGFEKPSKEPHIRMQKGKDDKFLFYNFGIEEVMIRYNISVSSAVEVQELGVFDPRRFPDFVSPDFPNVTTEILRRNVKGVITSIDPRGIVLVHVHKSFPHDGILYPASYYENRTLMMKNPREIIEFSWNGSIDYDYINWKDGDIVVLVPFKNTPTNNFLNLWYAATSYFGAFSIPSGSLVLVREGVNLSEGVIKHFLERKIGIIYFPQKQGANEAVKAVLSKSGYVSMAMESSNPWEVGDTVTWKDVRNGRDYGSYGYVIKENRFLQLGGLIQDLAEKLNVPFNPFFSGGATSYDLGRITLSMENIYWQLKENLVFEHWDNDLHSFNRISEKAYNALSEDQKQSDAGRRFLALTKLYSKFVELNKMLNSSVKDTAYFVLSLLQSQNEILKQEKIRESVSRINAAYGVVPTLSPEDLHDLEDFLRIVQLLVEKDSPGILDVLASEKSNALAKLVSSSVGSQGGEEIKTSASPVGGIDFNALPIQTESVASSALGALPGGRVFKGDLDAEWARIQDVFNAGIRPSIQRLSEYTAAASASPLAEDKIDQIRVMLADILRRDEENEKLTPAEESCKQLIRVLENETIPT